MKDAFEIRGYWFLPHAPQDRVAGTLTYIPNGKITLELIGSFAEDEDTLFTIFTEEAKQVEVIHGESSDSKEITLLGCSAYGSHNFACSFSMQKFSVQFVLKGIYIDQKAQEAFHSITVMLPHLTSWVNSYRVKYSIPYTNERPSGFNLGYDLENINLITVALEDDLELELEFTCTPPGSGHSEKLLVQQQYQLNITSKNNLSFLDLLRQTSKFKTFLTFGTLNSIYYYGIDLYSPVHYQELSCGRKHFHPISLYYNQYHTTHASQKENDHFLFRHDAIEGVFQSVIKRWYGFDKQMAPILKHLIESISAKEIFNTGDFLILVQALEGYCHRFRPNLPKKKKRITLKEQLEGLQQEFLFVPLIRDLKIDIDTVVNSRHYYSHFFSKVAGTHVAEGVELYLLAQKLKALLICCVLTETGFDPDHITAIMDKYKDRH